MTAKRSRGARSVWKAFDELTPEFAAVITEFDQPSESHLWRDGGSAARALRVDGKIFGCSTQRADSQSRCARIRADRRRRGARQSISSRCLPSDEASGLS